jgi:hypothetical protein
MEDNVPCPHTLAFLELGDKTNARNFLKRVIEKYPHSDNRLPYVSSIDEKRFFSRQNRIISPSSNTLFLIPHYLVSTAKSF